MRREQLVAAAHPDQACRPPRRTRLTPASLRSCLVSRCVGGATARPGGQDEAKEASGRLTPHGENRCCWSQSFLLHASRRHCTCSRIYFRSAGRAGASSARVWPACSGRRKGSRPPTRQSYLPCAHSRPGKPRECPAAPSQRLSGSPRRPGDAEARFPPSSWWSCTWSARCADPFGIDLRSRERCWHMHGVNDS